MGRKRALSPSDVPKLSVRQKANLSSAEQASSSSTSKRSCGNLALLLLEFRAWGFISAILIQQIAAAAVADGLVCDKLEILADIGSKGKWKNNCERDLNNHLAPTPLRSTLNTLSLSMKGLANFVYRIAAHILYPHELFAALFTFHPAVFLERMCGGSVDNVISYWNAMQQHPSIDGNPDLKNKDKARWCIPLSFHGDGVTCAGVGKSWSRAVDIFSWSSVLDKGALIQRVFMIFLIHKLLVCKLPGQNTMDQFWKHLAWSFSWLERGLWPDRNADGNMYAEGTPEQKRALTTLAGGWRGILWIIKGDLEFFVNSLGLDSYSGHDICFLCKANTSTIPWTDFRKGRALWLSQIWKFAEWLLVGPRNPILSLKGVSITDVIPDLLHCKHLGTDAYFYGSVLLYLVTYIMVGNKQSNMERLWKELKEQCLAINMTT